MVDGKKAIVVGASSGIGRALARVLAEAGYELGLVSRRTELLEALQKELPAKACIRPIDVSRPDQAMPLLSELINQMPGVDLIILNAGVNASKPDFNWPGEKQTIEVNISGFAACANLAVQHFLAQNHGHLVGISSIAGLRGSARCPAYNASKAFVSNYLQGLRYKLSRHNIYVTDIRPGLVDTDMVRDIRRRFWVSTPQAAARQILSAIKKRKKVAYITGRWLLIAWLIRFLPDWAYARKYRYE